MVMRVKASPAREPKGLEPPTPPRAPTSPPPLPRWINTSRIRNRLRIRRIAFSGPGRADQIAKSVTAGSFLAGSLKTGNNRNGIIGPPGGGEKATWAGDRGQESGVRSQESGVSVRARGSRTAGFVFLPDS